MNSGSQAKIQYKEVNAFSPTETLLVLRVWNQETHPKRDALLMPA